MTSSRTLAGILLVVFALLSGFPLLPFVLGILLIFREPRQPDLLRHLVLFWVLVSGGMDLYLFSVHGEVLVLASMLLFHVCLGALVGLELTPSEAIAVGVAGGASLLFAALSASPLPA